MIEINETTGNPELEAEEVEQWRLIEGHETYMVSNKGRVKSLDRLVNSGLRYNETVLKKGKILKLCNSNGYHIVTLNPKKSKSVHRLVAQAFIPNPENKPCINHIDSNRSNNKPSNLEWCTFKENAIHGFKYGYRVGNKVFSPVNKYSMEGIFIESFDSLEDAKNHVGTPSRSGADKISKCCNGKIPSAFGFIWKFKNNN